MTEALAWSEPARRRRLRARALVALLLAGVAVAWLVAGQRAPAPSRPSARGADARTATVRRRTLVERENVDGTLGYAGSRTVVNRVAGGDGSRGGPAPTVTWLPPAGSVVRPGGTLYRLDDRPVVLMDGAVPAYRRMAAGTGRGPDVRQLEANLVALGFGSGVVVDGRYATATATAVKRWQRAVGLRATGAVELGSVVFMRGARRIAGARTTVGAPTTAGAEVVATTSSRRVVQVELDVAKQTLARRGAQVVVTLPDGSAARGRVASVGRAAHAKDSSGGDGAGGGDAGGGGSDSDELVVDVTIALRSVRRLGRLDQAPVTVVFERAVARHVLSVPVTALLARPGGRYAVEVLGAGIRRTVAVQTGSFADGYVAIRGRGLRPGAKVVVPE